MHVITRGRFDLVPRYVLTEPGTFWPGDVGTRWRFDIDPSGLVQGAGVAWVGAEEVGGRSW